MSATQHWLIWDGECGLCRRTVAWIERRDQHRRFRAVPFQRCPSPPMTPELRRESQRAVQVITGEGRRVSAGRAVLFILAELGWHRTLVRLAQLPPLIWAVELGYRVVARNRNFFGRFMFRGDGADGASCEV